MKNKIPQTAKAQYELGLDYMNQFDALRNDKNENGNYIGMYFLEMARYPGLFVNADTLKIIKEVDYNEELRKEYLSESYREKILNAQELYDNGIFWIRLAAINGNMEAQYYLFEEGYDIWDTRLGINSEAFLESDAFNWCKKAAESGYSKAEVSLARHYLNVFQSILEDKSQNNDQTYEKEIFYANQVIYWYGQGIKKDNLNSIIELGMAYHDYFNDNEKAIYFLEKALELSVKKVNEDYNVKRPYIMVHLAHVYEKKGNYHKAHNLLLELKEYDADILGYDGQNLSSNIERIEEILRIRETDRTGKYF
ncbi:hypothetical protein [Kaistella sp.]|uniref:hypothetical protein n=1 Tax=Kaistella sp. TaxID=2782235 RepID=UPI0035A16CDE